MDLVPWCQFSDTRRGQANSANIGFDLERFFEAAETGLCVVAADGSFIRANARLRKLLGYSVRELSRLTLGDVAPELRDLFIHARRHRGGQFAVSFTRRDGTEVPFAVTMAEAAVSMAEPEFLVSVHEIAQGELAREILVEELDHRLKNVFATIDAALSAARRNAATTDELAQEMGARVAALKDAHDHAFCEGDNSLASLINKQLAPFMLAGSRFSLRGPKVGFSTSATSYLSLIVHELTTNSLKHGALRASRGAIKIVWRSHMRSGRPGLIIRWIESGVPAPGTPEREGRGIKMIRACLDVGLGGAAAFKFTPDGLRVEMWISGAVLQDFEESFEGGGAEVSNDSATRGGLAGLRVLIVEDSSPIALNLEALVRGEGALAWGVAANVASALGALSKGRPDVALLDVNLEGESVLSIAERLRALDVPFAFTTAYSESPFDLADWPNQPVLHKPYADRDVISALKALTGRS